MRKIVIAAAAALALAGCSGSSSSSSSGSTSTSGSTGNTSATTTASSTTSGSSSTTSSSTSTTSSSTTTGSTSVSTSSSGSTGTTGSGSTSGSTGSSFCTPSSSSTSGSGSGSTGSTNDWSCLGTVTPPTPTSSSATVSLTFNDRGSNPVLGMTVKLCKRSDTTCATPDDTQVTDATGAVTLTAPLGSTAYDGYFQNDMTDAGSGDFVWPQLTFVPLFASNVTFPLVSVKDSDVQTLSLFTGTPNAARGQIVGNISDCSYANGQGVVVGSTTTDSTSKVFYFQYNASFGAEVPTQGGSTDSTGNYIITNVPAGTPTVSAALAGSCSAVSSAPVITRAATITSVILNAQ